jgi:hypothetical protein
VPGKELRAERLPRGRLPRRGIQNPGRPSVGPRRATRGRERKRSGRGPRQAGDRTRHRSAPASESAVAHSCDSFAARSRLADGLSVFVADSVRPGPRTRVQTRARVLRSLFFRPGCRPPSSQPVHRQARKISVPQVQVHARARACARCPLAPARCPLTVARCPRPAARERSASVPRAFRARSARVPRAFRECSARAGIVAKMLTKI